MNTLRFSEQKAFYSLYKGGLVKGQKNAFKKAIVTLKEGETIDFTAIFNKRNGST